MANYLVTGGAGFIGSHIVRHLVALKQSVRVIDNLSSGRLEKLGDVLDKIEFVKGDIRDQNVVISVMEGIDYVLHQAALRSVPRSMTRPGDYNDVNVWGTLNLLMAARNQEVKHFVLASSSSVYGLNDIFPQEEGLTTIPISPYALTKLMGEQYCSLFSRAFHLPTTSLRYFNVFGPRQGLDDDYAVVVPKFIVSLSSNISPPIYGDGKQSRDFTYVDNVVAANLACCLSHDKISKVYNVACGETHSVLELFEILSRLLKSSVKPTFQPPRPGDVYKSHADISSIQRDIQWRPLVGFEEGLIRTIQWFRENPIS